jgi:hypothetical protein
MTILEFTLSLIIYLIIGLWICWKMKWYYILPTSIVIVAMPISLIYVLIKQFVLKEWNNN